MISKGKWYFKNPKTKECMGFQDRGTCMECIQKDTSKIGCKKLGEYLNKKDWNRIIANGPLQQKDYRAREATVSPNMQGKEVTIDKYGRELRNGSPRRLGVPFNPRKVA